MKVKSFIIIFVFISCFSFSQEKVKDPYKGWYFGPNISYSAISGFYNDQLGFDPRFRNNQLSYSGGIDAAYAFGRKYNFTFGIQYQEIRDSYVNYWRVDSVLNPNQIDNTFTSWTSKYLVLPAHMNLCFFKGAISPYIITGFSPAIFLSNSSVYRIRYTNGMEKETREHYSSIDNQYRDIQLLWQLGIGIDVNLNKTKFRAFVYNTGSYHNLFTSVSRYFYYSIHTGISYYLKTSHR